MKPAVEANQEAWRERCLRAEAEVARLQHQRSDILAAEAHGNRMGAEVARLREALAALVSSIDAIQHDLGTRFPALAEAWLRYRAALAGQPEVVPGKADKNADKMSGSLVQLVAPPDVDHQRLADELEPAVMRWINAWNRRGLLDRVEMAGEIVAALGRATGAGQPPKRTRAERYAELRRLITEWRQETGEDCPEIEPVEIAGQPTPAEAPVRVRCRSCGGTGCVGDNECCCCDGRGVLDDDCPACVPVKEAK